MRSILATLRNARISPTEFLTHVLEDSECISFRTSFYSDHNVPRFNKLLDTIWMADKGCTAMKNWMWTHAVDLVCNTVYEEFESAKPALRMSANDVTPEFISNWDINSFMEPIGTELTPIWCRILEAATETKEAKEKHKKPKSRNRLTGRNVISAQVHYLRSFHSFKVQIGLGLMAWTSGASRQLISVLNQSCLSMSFPTITKIIEALADRSIEDARTVAAGPHTYTHDNINLTHSIFTEQTPNMPHKVQSGTFAVLYKLVGGRAEDMKLAPMILNLRNSSPLAIPDLRLSRHALMSYQSQIMVHYVKILIKFVPGLAHYGDNPMFQTKSRRPLPPDHKTQFYPLRVSTIEEASIKGNILVQDDVYHKDVSSWTRREIFQLGFGVFHLTMNLIWALLHIHRGTIDQHGTLTHLFAILEKVRLGGEHPDFHALRLLAVLTQILEGLVLNAWRRECGFPNLDKFAESKPEPNAILKLAQSLISKYATPNEDLPPTVKETKKASTADSSDSESDHIIHENIVRLTRDLTYVYELVHATSAGDFGRIEDILPDLACIFRGAGSNNDSTEILHFLFSLKEVWTPDFA
ncbi:hypothetical protein L208DRAFT_1329384 [Tricholoma matsutake]|nr:hypothetical protein L208DRAFT_1329384 [Tricholoma matsutake 945]